MQGRQGRLEAIVDAASSGGVAPWFAASQEGHEAVVRLLLARGAGVNKATTDQGETPLYIASCYGHTAVVKLLLDRGVDISKPTTNTATTTLSHRGIQRSRVGREVASGTVSQRRVGEPGRDGAGSRGATRSPAHCRAAGLLSVLRLQCALSTNESAASRVSWAWPIVALTEVTTGPARPSEEGLPPSRGAGSSRAVILRPSGAGRPSRHRRLSRQTAARRVYVHCAHTQPRVIPWDSAVSEWGFHRAR